MSECRRCGRAAGDAFACTTCSDTAKADLTQIADFALHLDDKRARLGSNWKDGTIGRAAEIPLPYDPRVSKVADPIRVALLGTARIIVHAGAVILPISDDIHDVALWLVNHCDWLRRQDVGPHEFAEFNVCRSNLVQLFDRPPDRMYIGRCKGTIEDVPCIESLYVEVDDNGKPATGTVKCRRCSQGHDVKDRREEMKAGVKDYLGTMREITRLCRLMYDDGVSMSMLYLYAEKGLMESQGWRMEHDSKGRYRSVSTYRIGDVEAAIKKWAAIQEARRAEKKPKCVA
jgi:hypothetical protein